jgi:hypothetical protein
MKWFGLSRAVHESFIPTYHEFVRAILSRPRRRKARR